MRVLYDDARAFCAGKTYDLHMCKLTTQQLGLSRSTDYPAGSHAFITDVTHFSEAVCMHLSILTQVHSCQLQVMV